MAFPARAPSAAPHTPRTRANDACSEGGARAHAPARTQASSVLTPRCRKRTAHTTRRDASAAPTTRRKAPRRAQKTRWTNSPTRCARPSRKKPRSPSRTSCAAAPRRSGRWVLTEKRRTSWARSARRSCKESTRASARRRQNSATSSSTSSPRPTRARRASSPAAPFYTGVHLRRERAPPHALPEIRVMYVAASRGARASRL